MKINRNIISNPTEAERVQQTRLDQLQLNQDELLREFGIAKKAVAQLERRYPNAQPGTLPDLTDPEVRIVVGMLERYFSDPMTRGGVVRHISILFIRGADNGTDGQVGSSPEIDLHHAVRVAEMLPEGIVMPTDPFNEDDFTIVEKLLDAVAKAKAELPNLSGDLLRLLPQPVENL